MIARGEPRTNDHAPHADAPPADAPDADHAPRRPSLAGLGRAALARTARIAVGSGMVLLSSGMVGCAARPDAAPDAWVALLPEEAPTDLALSITVAPGAAAGASGSDILEPAWYVVDADGTLRAALGVRTPESALPPAVRVLSLMDRADLWTRTREALGPRPDPARPDTGVPMEAGTGPIALHLRADGRRRDLSPPADGPTQALIAHVRDLAWILPPDQR